MNENRSIYFAAIPKLAVSGHMLIYVVHTKERWFRYLPNWEVVSATVITQIIATILVLTGVFMSAKISLEWVVFVWVWALFWMQISDLMKDLQKKIFEMHHM